jgi:5-hydroxyisourate hydrolase-like protein (transthyretin family)
MTVRTVALACVLGVAHAVTAFGQQTPPRDNGVKAVGTASIAGLVLADDSTKRPVRRATVTLASGDLKIPASTVTDDEGRFVFTGLPAGNFSLTASKAAWVTTFYGSGKPGRGPGVPIALLEGQHVSDIRMTLLHGSVITGTLHHGNGRPAIGVDVLAMPVQTTNGQRRGQLIDRPATTDERGIYRVYGLPPGEYFVQALVGNTDMFGAGEVRRVTGAEVEWAQHVTSQASSTAPGASGATGAPMAPAPDPGPRMSYATVYFPGTADASSAVTVTVGPNEEREGIDFVTVLVPTARITGFVVDANGRPAAGTQVTLRPVQNDQSDIVRLLIGESGARANAEGRFTLSGVRPGRYTLAARGAPASQTRGGSTAASAMLSGLFGGASVEGTTWAEQDLTIDGRDLPDISLALQPAMAVAGKLVFEASVLAPPADLTRARITLTTMPTGGSPLEMAMTMLGSGGTMANAVADGTFVLKGVTPNTYKVSVVAPGMLVGTGAVGSGWVLKSVMLDGRDIADLPFQIRPNQNLSGIVATFTDRPTELTGTLQDQAGRAAAGYPIVIFSTDRRYWLPGSRRVQQVRPASDGTFRLVGLPAGDYFVCAVTDLEPNALADTGFLEQLAAAAFTITLADGEKKTQDLKLAGGGGL